MCTNDDSRLTSKHISRMPLDQQHRRRTRQRGTQRIGYHYHGMFRSVILGGHRIIGAEFSRWIVPQRERFYDLMRQVADNDRIARIARLYRERDAVLGTLAIKTFLKTELCQGAHGLHRIWSKHFFSTFQETCGIYRQRKSLADRRNSRYGDGHFQGIVLRIPQTIFRSGKIVSYKRRNRRIKHHFLDVVQRNASRPQRANPRAP